LIVYIQYLKTVPYHETMLSGPLKILNFKLIIPFLYLDILQIALLSGIEFKETGESQ
jgi:hypothetical protein